VNQNSENEEVFGLNCLFINSGDHKILIDTGCGDGFQSTAGWLAQNLEAEGIRRADIDRIIFTHGHIDHVGGSFDSQGRPIFPNARYITSDREWECWLTKPESSELQSMFFSAARKNLLPIQDQFNLVKEDVEILPGIKLIAAPGHTPGNIMVDISSDEERLLCIGDIIHSQLEFIHPEYLSSFDVKPEQALHIRAQILSDVAKSGILVFACHFPFPGLGYITHNEGVFTWQPI
jgi:glyoxylase-like metal-dependent hydrolase (beta-lactamase superfamily II)